MSLKFVYDVFNLWIREIKEIFGGMGTVLIFRLRSEGLMNQAPTGIEKWGQAPFLHFYLYVPF